MQKRVNLQDFQSLNSEMNATIEIIKNEIKGCCNDLTNDLKEKKQMKIPNLLVG